MRHGKSVANAQGIIVSGLQNGIRDTMGLVEEGKEQVKQSIDKHIIAGHFTSETILIASPFTRCQQTAQIVREYISAAPIETDERLRERWFGDLDGAPIEQYEKIWLEDHANKPSSVFHAESVHDVFCRMNEVIQSLEQRFEEPQTILLVSHGDPIQILLTNYHEVQTREHRSIPPMSLAEIRRLKE